MSLDGEDTRWMCGRASGMVNLHRVSLNRVSSIVREIRDPCLPRPPAQGSKMLKPEKWQAVFDSEGKVLSFRKALKLIILGGVDPSIRGEVWEFLLGCYALGSTTEYRRQLRMARRERYENLIRQCQKMHSSVGTGTLAYVVGSKVMDMRTLSKDSDTREAVASSGQDSDAREAVASSGQASHSFSNRIEAYRNLDDDCIDTSYTYESESSSVPAELAIGRGRKCNEDYSISYPGLSSDAYNCYAVRSGSQAHEHQYIPESYIDFPALPVTNLFEGGDIDGRDCEIYDGRISAGKDFEDVHMHSFHINNNVDLVMETGDSCNQLCCTSNSETAIFSSDVQENSISEKDFRSETVSRLRISDIPESAMVNATTFDMSNANEERVSEWLWTLHRIVVDVVRTDSHLEFYGESKNMARMSDILAVYAWIDPATGYCQGMSDLLSPFVVLYEDDADAFWCFEMLLRRMRENFQMEGPTGVMKQLQALLKILELTDADIFEHLSLIGAESLHFAFRMLLVLFRRELSFNEALCMWEMMWAADFDEAVTQQSAENCLEPLALQLEAEQPIAGGETESTENGKRSMKKSTGSWNCNQEPGTSYGTGVSPTSSHPLCGLTRANFWARHGQLQACSTSSTAAAKKNADDELPVFCVAAILIINRQKIIRETHSIDDVIKMFNDNRLKIKVKRCIRMAIKLRKKYFYKLIKQASTGGSEQ